MAPYKPDIPLPANGIMLKISTHVMKALESLKDGQQGVLLTANDEGDGVAMLMKIASPDIENEGEQNAEFLGNIPYGLKINTSFKCTTDITEIDTRFDMYVRIDPVYSEVNAFFNTTPIRTVTITDQEIATKFFMTRIRAVIPFTCEATVEGIEHSITDLEKKLTNNAAFPELMGKDKTKPYDIPGGKKTFNSIKDIDIVPITLRTSMDGRNMEASRAPLIKVNLNTKTLASFDLRIDSLSIISRKSPVGAMREALIQGLVRHVACLRSCLIWQLDKKFKTLAVPEVFHCLPENFSSFITIACPRGTSEDDLRALRTRMHAAFGLPMDRPLLTRSNAYNFDPPKTRSELQDPHLSVAASGVVGGEPVTVYGHYSYHHYCQGGVDDDGWGCAYRSLQTLCSWFRHQGYTTKDVPTIEEIQRCLVDIGDKPSSFVGSRQWIGSTEVGFCLESLFGISCRIINVSSGEELGMKGGELSHHFKTQGTPIMIGGGNLAHTILGVDYNRKTGDIKFLILDPHYKGDEVLSTIVSKGWCGWKGLEFWKKSSFYNMCLPLKPKDI